MAIPVATALGRRERLWPAVLVSVAVHAGLVAVALARRQPAVDLDQTPIVAKLVRLGPKKPQEYLPRKEATPPPGPPAPVAAPPAPVAAAPAPAPAKPAPKPVAAAPARPAPKTAPASGGGSLSSVLDRMKKQVEQDRWGDPSGDPLGDSEDGSAGDRYVALVRNEIKSNYQNYIRVTGSLKAVVVLYLEPDGTISTWRFQTRSGNSACDDAIERAIRRTTRLPPPPRDQADTFRRVGLGFNFDC